MLIFPLLPGKLEMKHQALRGLPAVGYCLQEKPLYGDFTSWAELATVQELSVNSKGLNNLVTQSSLSGRYVLKNEQSEFVTSGKTLVTAKISKLGLPAPIFENSSLAA